MDKIIVRCRYYAIGSRFHARGATRPSRRYTVPQCIRNAGPLTAHTQAQMHGVYARMSCFIAAPQHYHRRAQAPSGAVGHERGARPSDVTPTPSRSQVASICHGRAHQSCVHSLARCVLCARVCERALSQVRQQVRGSTRDHRHSPSQHQHTTTQNSAAVTGTQPIEVRSAPTCLVSHTACRLSRSTSAAGAASVSVQRRSPVSAANPTARGVAASSRKKGQKCYFFLYT